ncbi:MAG: efflux RND transporter periplasmic adaptor subunit [Bacteroidetes bacterium]|nr:efflux RND transporter periplasmic adaptor subunit [Fibrella sp.]
MKKWLALGLVALLLGGLIYYNKFMKSGPGEPGSGSGGGGAAGGGKGGAGSDGKGGAGSAPSAISAYVVAMQNLKEEVVSSGSLLPNEQVDIYPEVAGRIVQMNIREGQPVGKGALLLKLYDGDLQAQLQRLYAQEENTRRTEERNKQLLTRGGISQQEYDIATTNLRSAQADIELVKANLSKTEIRAPFSGVIGLRNVSPGAVVTPGTLIARMQQISSLKLDFSIPEKYGSSVKQGSDVTFEVDGTNGVSRAVVYAIDPGVDEQNRNLRIRARVNNASSRFRPGTFARVTLTIQNERSLVVPTQSVIPQTRDKQVVVIKNGKAVFKTVTTGIRTANAIQILTGVQVGDTVATTGLLFMKPDGPVKVAKLVKLPTADVPVRSDARPVLPMAGSTAQLTP